MLWFFGNKAWEPRRVKPVGFTISGAPNSRETRTQAPPPSDPAYFFPDLLLLLLLVPLLVMGVAGVHARAKGRPARVPMLALFYLLLAMFLQVMGPAMVGLGLYDHFRRRAPSAPPSV